MISAVRFFWVAPLHSRYMWIALAAVLVSGVAMLIANPSKGSNVLAPLALLQMLAASSGFTVAARRGHYDLLLTAGPGRFGVALVHLLWSILPGLLVWLTLGIVEMLVLRTLQPTAFAAGSVVAMSTISTLAWALTVGLPRLGGGIGWLLGIAVCVVGWGETSQIIQEVADGGLDGVTGAIVVTLCPFVVLGIRLSIQDLAITLPLIALAAAAAATSITWIVRMDVPLESAQ